MSSGDASEEPEVFGCVQVRAAAADARLASLLESRPASELDEAELVDAMAAHQRLANLHEGQVLAFMGELDARRGAGERRDCRGGRDITPRAQTVTEVVAATRQAKGRVQHLLQVAARLRESLPGTAAMLAAGRISGYQARVIADEVDALVDADKAADVETRVLAEVTADNTGPTADTDLAAATSSEVRQIAARAVAEIEPGEHERRHRQAFAGRGVDKRTDEDGMATLRLVHTGLAVESIYHRLGAIARTSTISADSRTLEQKVADLMVAILSGQHAARVPGPGDGNRSAGGSTPGASSDDARPDGAGPDGRRACGGCGWCGWCGDVYGALKTTQVNITMTLASLAGFSDTPGRLLGGGLVPASVAREIAYRPDSTWYRLLTDDTGRMLELSSQGYRPDAPLSRSVQLQHQRCVQVGCKRPADTCQHDHEVPWPQGATEQANLSPKCQPHHNGKTAGRFGSTKAADGTVCWTYPTGHTYTKRPPPHPVDAWPGDWVEPESCQQVQAALGALKRERDRAAQTRLDQIKEHLRDRQRERLLAGWRAVYPPDEDEPPDPDRPSPTPDDYAAAHPVLIEMLR